MTEAIQEAEEIVGKARTEAERLEAEAKSKTDKLEQDARTRAQNLDSEVEAKRREMLGDLEREKRRLDTEVEDLRGFRAGVPQPPEELLHRAAPGTRRQRRGRPSSRTPGTSRRPSG